MIGFIQNPHSQLLITQRSLDSHYGGSWELPGGKVELGESPYEALQRELWEELAFQIDGANCFEELPGDLSFYLFHINYPDQEPILQAGQLSHAWIDPEQISDYIFPPSNQLFFDSWRYYQSK